MDILRRIDDLVGWIEDVFLALSTSLLAVLLFANVLLRYVFKSPFAWLEEVVVAIFVWFVFIGVSASFRSHQHLRIDILIRYLPRAASLAVGAAAVALTFGLLLLLAKLGYDYALFVSSNRTPVLNISAAWVYVGLPLGMVFSLIHLIRQTIDEGPDGALRSVLESPDLDKDAVEHSAL